MSLSVGFVGEHQRLHLDVGVALANPCNPAHFPRPAKTARHSKCDHQLQEVENEGLKFAHTVHWVHTIPNVAILMKTEK
jgi:hypothetical protein